MKPQIVPSSRSAPVLCFKNYTLKMKPFRLQKYKMCSISFLECETFACLLTAKADCDVPNLSKFGIDSITTCQILL